MEGNEEMKKKENGGVKITVSGEAEKSLEEMVAKTNEGFSGGRVSKQDLASWIIRYFDREAFSRCMEMIRADHFDQVAHLEAVLRQVKQGRRSGMPESEIAVLLNGYAGAHPQPLKKSRKTEQQMALNSAVGAL